MDSIDSEHVSALEGIVVTYDNGPKKKVFSSNLDQNSKAQFYELDLKEGKIVGCEIIKKHSREVKDIKYGLKFNIAWLNTKPGAD